MKLSRISILFLLLFLFVPSLAFAQSSRSSTTDKSWQSFWTQFSAAVKKKDKSALKAMMSSSFEYCSDNITPSKAIQWLEGDKGQGWLTANRIIAKGTAPYQSRGVTGKARVAPSNGGKESYSGWWAVFELRNGRWLWRSFVCPGE